MHPALPSLVAINKSQPHGFTLLANLARLALQRKTRFDPFALSVLQHFSSSMLLQFDQVMTLGLLTLAHGFNTANHDRHSPYANKHPIEYLYILPRRLYVW